MPAGLEGHPQLSLREHLRHQALCCLIAPAISQEVETQEDHLQMEKPSLGNAKGQAHTCPGGEPASDRRARGAHSTPPASRHTTVLPPARPLLPGWHLLRKQEADGIQELG